MGADRVDQPFQKLLRAKRRLIRGCGLAAPDSEPGSRIESRGRDRAPRTRIHAGNACPPRQLLPARHLWRTHPSLAIDCPDARPM